MVNHPGNAIIRDLWAAQVHALGAETVLVVVPDAQVAVSPTQAQWAVSLLHFQPDAAATANRSVVEFVTRLRQIGRLRGMQWIGWAMPTFTEEGSGGPSTQSLDLRYQQGDPRVHRDVITAIVTSDGATAIEAYREPTLDAVEKSDELHWDAPLSLDVIASTSSFALVVANLTGQ